MIARSKAAGELDVRARHVIVSGSSAKGKERGLVVEHHQGQVESELHGCHLREPEEFSPQ